MSATDKCAESGFPACPWKSGDLVPETQAYSEKDMLVAVRRGHSGKVYSFCAIYLNSYLLFFEDGEEERETTGWFTTSPSEDGLHYDRLLGDRDELVAWAYPPVFPGAER